MYGCIVTLLYCCCCCCCCCCLTYVGDEPQPLYGGDHVLDQVLANREVYFVVSHNELTVNKKHINNNMYTKITNIPTKIS